MKVQIEVKMGGRYCESCIGASFSEGCCNIFGVDIEWDAEEQDYLRCPECLSKYGTGDKPDNNAPFFSPTIKTDPRIPDGVIVIVKPKPNEPTDPRDAVVAAAREEGKLFAVVMRTALDGPKGTPIDNEAWLLSRIKLKAALAALDAEGGR